MTLRGARILSSCNDSSNKQEQKMNVNIRVEDKSIPSVQQPSVYPQVQPVNFTSPMQSAQTTFTPPPMQQVQPTRGQSPQLFEPEPSAYPSVAVNPVLTRDVEGDLAKDSLISDLETKNKFLNMLLTVYQNNPIYINSYVICDAQILMSMIKLLTNCDKVDLVLNEDLACGGCGGNDKLIFVSKILVTKGDKTEDLKYAYNEVYSKFVSYGISLKVVC